MNNSMSINDSLPTDSNQLRDRLVILELNNQKVWVKLATPIVHDQIFMKAQEVFPLLKNSFFFFTDINDARLDYILVDYILGNPSGVTLKIQTFNDDVVICDIDHNNLSNPNILQNYTSEKVTTTPDPNISCDDDNDSLHSPPAKKKNIEDRQALKNFDKEKLRRLILATAYGDDLMKEYDQNQYLSTANHKKIIRLIVKYLLDYKDKIKRTLSSNDKAECAAAVIELFPNLRNPHGKLGYEHFYDSTSSSGYIATGLSNSSRKKPGSNCVKSIKDKSSDAVLREVTETQAVNETVDVKDAIEFMKSAVPDQKDDIILKIQLIHDIRRFLHMNENFFTVYPRFLDVPELIDVEFKLLFPEIASDIFIKTFPKYILAALDVYEVEKRDKSMLDWDQVTNSLISLTQLVPPTAKGKKNAIRVKTKLIVDKLIVLRPFGTPLQLKDSTKSPQPKLLAVGLNKSAISQYHISIDNHCISLKVKSIVEAIDALFKAHYVFNVKFDVDLKNFWIFMQHNFYGISSQCTN
ncbi:uncharacterized protein LOC141533033 [Cotesia typhae]|uniref:uncharacterized protein LOC141533033 n=1 Tax=Cotesia typhae TaxID=2053667 RepID=UPI003D68B2CF